MPRREAGMLGVFADPAGAAQAVRALRAVGASDVRAAMPAPFPDLVAALGRPRSWIGRSTLTAAALGTLGGFALCIGTSLAWPLVTGGKPIVTMPPFVIVAFELSVLVGAAVNLAGLTLGAARGRSRRAIPTDIRFAVDRIGIFVPAAEPRPAWEAVLREHGAEEIRHVA